MTEQITLDKLQIPEVDDRETVDELKGSIKQLGLLHGIVVTVDGRIHAGKRRAQAVKELGWKEVTCKVIQGTPDELEEVSIQENLIRRNLPWYDAVVLKKKLFDLRQKQLGKGRQGAKKVGFSLRDLANELQEGLGTLSQDLRLAEAVMANPNLRKIEDKTTAQRMVFAVAKRTEDELEATLPVKFGTNIVLCGDASAVLSNFPAASFNVCFTDPPWLVYKDKTLIKDESTLPVFEQVYRVLKNDAFLYVICSTYDFYVYLNELSSIGFKCQANPLFWVKKNVVSHGLRPWEYMRDYEHILLAAKGNPYLAQSTAPSAVYTSPAVHHTKAIHPNEKPSDVAEHFLNHCSHEGSLVLDPFGGSGSTAEACIKTGRQYVIIEKSKEFCNNIEKRIRDLVANKDKSTQS